VRGIGGTLKGRMTGALKDVGTAYGDVARAGLKAGRKVRSVNQGMAESFEAYRDRVVGAALDVINNAYQIIEDKAELVATNVELAELRKVIATGKATDEQKARYKELSQRQVELLVDLAAKGVTAGKLVSNTMNALRKRLKTATGEERKAILAAIRLLEQLQRAAELARIKIKTAVELAKQGLGSQGLIGGNWGPVGNAAGGDVFAGVPTIVGERRPELFVPQVNGHIFPTVGEGLAAIGAGGTTNIEVNLLDRLPIQSVRDLGAGLRMLERGRYLTGSRR
jgi:hypothetical protein